MFSIKNDLIFENCVCAICIGCSRGGDDMSFSEIREKDVINVCDGKRLGKPIDLMFNDSNCVEAIVVPAECGGLISFLKRNKEGCVIPWNKIRRIGDDVILVEVDSERFCD